MADGHEIVLHARGLSKEYGKGAALVRAVDNVDLDVARSEAVAIMGPSGCGKSTLLHLLGGLEHPSGGELWLGGQRVETQGETALAKLRRHMIGFVFQGFHLIDELTAAENVEMPALLVGATPLLGLRLAVRRPRRVILTTLSLIITDAMIVSALALHSSYGGGGSADVMVSQPGLGNPLLQRVNGVVLAITMILVVLAAINAIFITQATVFDAQQPSALARTFGATPRQVSSGLTVAQLIPALIAGILSLPVGTLAYRVAAKAAGGAPNTSVPVWWMIAVVAGTVAAVAVLTLLPARAGARRPVATVLRAE